MTMDAHVDTVVLPAPGDLRSLNNAHSIYVNTGARTWLLLVLTARHEKYFGRQKRGKMKNTTRNSQNVYLRILNGHGEINIYINKYIYYSQCWGKIWVYKKKSPLENCSHFFT